MFHTETRLTAPVPKLDGRSALLPLPRRLRRHVAMAALIGGGACTALWLAALAWGVFALARLFIG